MTELKSSILFTVYSMCARSRSSCKLSYDVDGSFSICSLQFSLCMMIAILVSSFIHSSKTVLTMSAEDGEISSSRVPPAAICGLHHIR